MMIHPLTFDDSVTRKENEKGKSCGISRHCASVVKHQLRQQQQNALHRKTFSALRSSELAGKNSVLYRKE